MLALLPTETRKQLPRVIRRPAITARTEQRAGKTTYVDIRNHRRGHGGGMNHTRHAYRSRRDVLRLFRVARRQLYEAEESGSHIEDHVRRDYVSLVDSEAGVCGVVVDVSAAHYGRTEAVGRPVLKAVKFRKQHVELVALVEDVVPPADRLVVPIAALVVRVEGIVIQVTYPLSASVWAGNILQNVLRHRADSALGNHVAGERVAPVSGPVRTAAWLRSHVAAEVGGEGIVNRDAIIAPVRATAQIEGDGSRSRAGERNGFLVTLVTQEHEIVVLAHRAADGAAELVDFHAAFGLAGHVGLEVIRVEHTVAQIVVKRAVPDIRTRLDGGVYCAAGFMTQGGVISGSNSLELLDCIDAGGEVPLAAVIADDDSIHREYIVAIALPRPIELIFISDIPSARTGKAARAELLLAEDDAWSE